MRESLTEEAVKKLPCTSPNRLVANAPAASRFHDVKPARCYVDAVSATFDVTPRLQL